MMKRYWLIVLGLILIIGWSFITFEAPAQEKQRKFVGVKTCKTCHSGTMAEKDVTKTSYDVWKEKRCRIIYF